MVCDFFVCLFCFLKLTKLKTSISSSQWNRDAPQTWPPSVSTVAPPTQHCTWLASVDHLYQWSPSKGITPLPERVFGREREGDWLDHASRMLNLSPFISEMVNLWPCRCCWSPKPISHSQHSQWSEVMRVVTSPTSCMTSFNHDSSLPKFFFHPIPLLEKHIWVNTFHVLTVNFDIGFLQMYDSYLRWSGRWINPIYVHCIEHTAMIIMSYIFKRAMGFLYFNMNSMQRTCLPAAPCTICWIYGVALIIVEVWKTLVFHKENLIINYLVRKLPICLICFMLLLFLHYAKQTLRI